MNTCNKLDTIPKTNTSGIRGVSWSKSMKKWKAVLVRNRKEVYVDYFDNIQDAKIAIEIERPKWTKFFSTVEDEIRNKLAYDPIKGVVTWKSKHHWQIPDNLVAERTSRDGYKRITLNGKSFMAHRVAWFLTHGAWPAKQLDHINRKRGDNRMSNLRLASLSDNRANTEVLAHSKSGVKGVRMTPSGKWKATINKNKQVVYYQQFNTMEEAEIAITAERPKHHGKFSHQK